MNQQLYEAGRRIVQSAPNLYIDLDAEADGIPGYGSLLSVGAVTPWGDRFYRELRPSSEVWIPGNREFCEQHNLERSRLMVEGIDPAGAMHDLADWVTSSQRTYAKRGKAILVAYNASFDAPWIDLEMKKAGIENPFEITGYCIRSLAMARATQYDWRSSSMKRLPRDLTPDGSLTHNALEDAEHQQAFHFALVGNLHGALPIVRLPRLHDD